jgi:hypothetical protein
MSTLKVIQIQHPSAASAALTLDASGNLSTSGTLTFPAGSASSPSIQATGDPNTGIFFPAADTIAFAEGGTEVLRIDSSGRLGLGTSSPGYRLDVRGPAEGNVNIQGGTAYGQLALTDGGSGVNYIDSTNTNLSIRTNTSSWLRLGTNNTTAVHIDSSQRVGIGTTSVNTTLEVQNSSTPIIRVGDGTRHMELRGGSTTQNAAIGTNYNGGFDIIQNGNAAVTIDTSKRVLVGTSTSFNTFALLQVYKASDDLHSVLNSASLSNGTAVLQRVQGGTASGDFGAYKHSGIASPCIFIDLQAQDGASNYYWTDNSDILRTSTSPTNIGTTGGTVVGTQTSDERIKNILGPVKYGLDTLKQIEPVRFSLKSEPETERLGFIAQQVQPLVPQSVFDTREHIEGEPEGAPTKLGMEYVALIPVLVNAIKELSAEVDALKAQLS